MFIGDFWAAPRLVPGWCWPKQGLFCLVLTSALDLCIIEAVSRGGADKTGGIYSYSLRVFEGVRRKCPWWATMLNTGDLLECLKYCYGQSFFLYLRINFVKRRSVDGLDRYVRRHLCPGGV